MEWKCLSLPLTNFSCVHGKSNRKPFNFRRIELVFIIFYNLAICKFKLIIDWQQRLKKHKLDRVRIGMVTSPRFKITLQIERQTHWTLNSSKSIFVIVLERKTKTVFANRLRQLKPSTASQNFLEGNNIASNYAGWLMM